MNQLNYQIVRSQIRKTSKAKHERFHSKASWFSQSSKLSLFLYLHIHIPRNTRKKFPSSSGNDMIKCPCTFRIARSLMREHKVEACGSSNSTVTAKGKTANRSKHICDMGSSPNYHMIWSILCIPCTSFRQKLHRPPRASRAKSLPQGRTRRSSPARGCAFVGVYYPRHLNQFLPCGESARNTRNKWTSAISKIPKLRTWIRPLFAARFRWCAFACIGYLPRWHCGWGQGINIRQDPPPKTSLPCQSSCK